MRRAVFPGSFDPITLGHKNIIDRSISLFDEIIIAVGMNPEKKYMFSLIQRMEFISKTFHEKKSISVKSYKGLTIEFCKKNNSEFLIRGLRSSNDFEFEKTIAHTNKVCQVLKQFFINRSKTSFISSSIVREIISNQGDFSKLVPKAVFK